MTAIPVNTSQLDIQSPFPGLRSYGEENADFFFGRKTHINELKLQMSTNRLLSVIGNSESGKSSFVHAGLVSDLQRDGFEINGRKNWIITSFTPRDKPVSDLALALALTKKPKPSLVTKNQLEFLVETLDTSGSQGIIQVYKALKLNQNKNLLIVIDQFDELFRQLELNTEESFFREVQQFINLLLHAGRQERYPIYFILTMRPDLIASAGRFPGLPEAINRGQYNLPKLNKKEIGKAVENTLSKVREINPRYWASTPEIREIAQQLVDDYIQEDNKENPPLPVVQVALLRMWENNREKKLIENIKEVLKNYAPEEQIEEIERFLASDTLPYTVSAQIKHAIQIERLKNPNRKILPSDFNLIDIIQKRAKALDADENLLPRDMLSKHVNEVFNTFKTEDEVLERRLVEQIRQLIEQHVDESDLFREIEIQINRERFTNEWPKQLDDLVETRKIAKKDDVGLFLELKNILGGSEEKEEEVQRIRKLIDGEIKKVDLITKIKTFVSPGEVNNGRSNFFTRLWVRIKALFIKRSGSSELFLEIRRDIDEEAGNNEAGLLWTILGKLTEQENTSRAEGANQLRQFINNKASVSSLLINIKSNLDINSERNSLASEVSTVIEKNKISKHDGFDFLFQLKDIINNIRNENEYKKVEYLDNIENLLNEQIGNSSLLRDIEFFLEDKNKNHRILNVIQETKENYAGLPSEEQAKIRQNEILLWAIMDEMGVSFSKKQRLCEKIFKGLIHTSVEGSTRLTRPVEYSDLRNLFDDEKNEQTTPVQEILSLIDNYQKELAQFKDLGEVSKNKKNDKELALDENDKGAADIWKRDPIGEIMTNKDNVDKRRMVQIDRQFDRLDRQNQDHILQEIIKNFQRREVAVLNTFGRSPRKENVKVNKKSNSFPILETVAIELSNESLLLDGWGWAALVDWKKEEEASANSYHRLLKATDTYQKQGYNAEFLWSNPADLGNGIRWMLATNPNESWAKRYDQAFKKQLEGTMASFFPAMSFLKASIEVYTKATLEEKAKQKKTLERERKLRKWSTWVAVIAGLACIAALFAFQSASRQKVKAETNAQEAQRQQRLAIGYADFAAKKEAEATVQAENAKQQRDSATAATKVAIYARQAAVNSEIAAKAAAAAAKRAQNEAIAAELDARKKEAEARLAGLDAKLQKILADQQRDEAKKSKLETESLRNLELVRKQSLNAELLIVNGQAERVEEDSLLYKIKTDHDNLLPEYLPVKEYLAALHAYFFYKYPQNKAIANINAGIRTALPLDISGEKLFILGDENGFLHRLQLNNDTTINSTAQKSFSAAASIRSMIFNKETNHLAVGTTGGDLIMLELNQKQKDITRLFKEIGRYPYPDESTAVIIQDIAFLGNDGDNIQLLVNKDVSAKVGDALEFFLFDKNQKKFKRQNEINVILPEVKDTNGVNHASVDAMFYDQDEQIIYIAGSNLALYSANLTDIIKGNSQTLSFQLRSIIPPNTRKRQQILDGKEGRKERITSITLSPDKKYLAAGLFYGDIYLLDMKETDPSKMLRAESTTTHYTQISELDFHSSNNTLYLAASSFDHSISLININKALDRMATKQKNSNISSPNIDDSVLNFKLHHSWVHGVQFFENQNGKLKLLSISEDGSARIWWTQGEDLENALNPKK